LRGIEKENNFDVSSLLVACPSGQRSAPRKRVLGKLNRGFKSHRHRS
jgi:hypothetical protein